MSSRVPLAFYNISSSGNERCSKVGQVGVDARHSDGLSTERLQLCAKITGMGRGVVLVIYSMDELWGRRRAQ